MLERRGDLGLSLDHGHPQNQMKKSIEADLIGKYIKYEEFGFIYSMLNRKRICMSPN
jgi:hypothetical protein